MGSLTENLKASLTGIVLPKTVKILNWKLALLYRFLQLGALILIIFTLAAGRTFYTKEAPVGSLVFWISYSDADYEEHLQRALSSDLCQKPDKFDYIYSEDWKYLDYTCTELPKYDRFRKEGDSSLFVPWSFRERAQRLLPLPSTSNASDPDACASLTETCEGGWQKRPVTGVPGTSWACRCNEEAMYFVIGTEAFSLSLEHFYEMIRESTGEVASQQHSSQSCTGPRWKCAEDRQELKTVVVLKKDGQEELIEDLVFVSPSPISLNLQRILSEAGYSLDRESTDLTENRLHCGALGADPDVCRRNVTKHPLLQITGAEIVVSVRYYNQRYKPDLKPLRDHTGTSCVIALSVSPTWTSKPAIDCAQPRRISIAESDCISRTFYGLEINMRTSGAFGFFDGTQFLLDFGAMISYLSMPFFIVYYLALFLLGPLGAFYAHSTCQELRADDALVSFATTSISAATQFRALTGECESICKEDVLTEINRAFHTMPGFSTGEQAHLAELVWDRLTESSIRCGAVDQQASREGGECNADGGDGLHEDEEANRAATMRVGLPVFVQSMAPGQLLRSLRRLFDQQRCRSPLETLFTPADQFRVKKRMLHRDPAKTSAPPPEQIPRSAAEHVAMFGDSD